MVSLEKTWMILCIFPGSLNLTCAGCWKSGSSDYSLVVQKVCVCVCLDQFCRQTSFFFSKKSFLQTFNWNYLSPQIWLNLICGLKVCLINGYLFDRANKLWAKKDENKVVISVFWNEDSFFSLLKGCVKTYVSNILNHCN